VKKYFTDNTGRKIAFMVGAWTGVILLGGLLVQMLFISMVGDSSRLMHKYLEWRNFFLVRAGSGILILISTIILTYVIIKRNLTTPLQKLTTLMDSAEKGDFLVRARVKGGDEIARLGQSFNKMLIRITDLYANQLEKDRELIVAQEEGKYRANLEEQSRKLLEANLSLTNRVKELSILFDVTRTINATLQLDEILRRITDTLGPEMGYRQFAVLLMNEERNKLVVKAAYGFADPTGINETVSFSRGEGIVWVVAETGGLMLIPDTRAEPRYMHYKGRQREDGCVLCLPMMHHGMCVGVLNFVRPLGESFEGNEVSFLLSIANQASIAIVNASLHQKTVELSITDMLTGVYNRRYLARRLNEELDLAAQTGQELSLLILDIDHFKIFNDINGHLAGDRALLTVAKTVESKTRNVDTVARFGGEEFCVILPNTGRAGAVEVADKLRVAVQDQRIRGEEGLPDGRLTVSLGVATFPGDGKDMRGLVDSADMALYHAKQDGRNRVREFRQGMTMPARPISSVVRAAALEEAAGAERGPDGCESPEKVPGNSA
jgi:diguanylate cyclase (GGDEF)-like protein